MSIVQIVILAIVQGLAELLPVSSSAHVVVASKLMHLDPASPEMTFLIVMLHTGTMFAVIAYFWKAWQKAFFPSMAVFKTQALKLIVATLLTGILGYGLIKVIEHAYGNKMDIDNLFGNLALIAVALAAAGVLIIVAGLSKKSTGTREVSMKEAIAMGLVQALCLPFRGFSRSGATISTGLLMGSIKARVEEFSFALAVLITPAAIGKEALRLLKHGDANPDAPPIHLGPLFAPGLVGLVFSFLAGWVALKFLSRVLEKGRWHLFGFYCLCFAIITFALYLNNY